MIEYVNPTPVVLQKMTITIGNTDCHLLLNSSSGCTTINLLNLSPARQVKFDCHQAQWSEKKPLQLKSFKNNFVETLGTLKTRVIFNDWKIPKTKNNSSR